MKQAIAIPADFYRPGADQDDLTGAVVSWHYVDGTPTVLSRYEDMQWHGAPVGAAEFESAKGNQIDFEKFVERSRARVRRSLYCSLRHPTRMNKPPTFATLIKKAQSLRAYTADLDARGQEMDRTTIEDTLIFLRKRAKHVSHIESLVGCIGTLREISAFASRGYLDFTVPLFETKKGAKAIAKRIWREVHGKDFDDAGYLPFLDDEITLIMKNAIFYIKVIAPALLPVAHQCFDAAELYPRRRFSRSEEGLCFRLQKKLISDAVWPALGSGLPKWPPKNVKQIMAHVRMCSAASAITFFFSTAGRRSSLLSLKDGFLETMPGTNESAVRLVYRKGEANFQGREILLPVDSDVIQGLHTQAEIKALMRRNIHGFVTAPRQTDQLFVLLRNKHFVDPDVAPSTGSTRKRFREINRLAYDVSQGLTGERGELSGVSTMGGPMTALAVNGMLRDFKTFLGLDIDGPIASHRFRETTGRLVTLSMEGAPLILQQILGHENSRTTLGYMFRSPFVQDELAEHYPELIVRNLKTLYAGRDHLVGGGAGQMKEALKQLGGVSAAALTEFEAGMTEHEFVELGIQMVREGYMVLSVLGPGIYCLKPWNAPGLCSRSGDELMPNSGRCRPNCWHHLQLGSGVPKLKRTVTWLDRKLADTDLSEPLKRYYGGCRADLAEALRLAE